MNTFVSYIAVLGILALVGLPSFIGHLRDRAIDRQLRDAERGMARTAEPGKIQTKGPRATCGHLSGQISPSKPAQPSIAT
ncbi:hypothetical protein [Streptomyces sp. NPDC127084]|uniref:hypothetical protein n=1 Tax=Streptomyces sp. NPDC127084 TaxID=3347133 RepID=UPI00365845E0